MNEWIVKNTGKHYITDVSTYMPSLVMTAQYSRASDDMLDHPKFTSMGAKNRKCTSDVGVLSYLHCRVVMKLPDVARFYDYFWRIF